MHEQERDPDWTIDLSRPPREPQTDPRLSVVSEAVRSAQTQLLTIVSTMKFMEEVIRDCAAQGITRDEIVDQCSLDAAAVDRVLAGGTLFNFPE